MRTFLTTVLLLTAFSLLAPLAGAQNSLGSTGNTIDTTGSSLGQTGNTIPSGTSVTLINPLGTGATLNSLLTSILEFVVRIGSIVVVLMLVFVGYKFVVAQGKEADIREARTMLLWTIVGALILLGAEAIAKGIEATVQALSTGG